MGLEFDDAIEELGLDLWASPRGEGVLVGSERP
jgi:hypothetical protein